jgi:hypothetical protein
MDFSEAKTFFHVSKMSKSMNKGFLARLDSKKMESFGSQGGETPSGY